MDDDGMMEATKIMTPILCIDYKPSRQLLKIIMLAEFMMTR